MAASDDYFILEKPLGSQSLDDPKMSSIRKPIDDGAIYRVRADGCTVGHVDRHTGHAQYAPLEILTSRPVIAEQLPAYRCSKDHEHSAVCSGDVSRKGPERPDSLDQIVLGFILMQTSRDADNDPL